MASTTASTRNELVASLVAAYASAASGADPGDTSEGILPPCFICEEDVEA